MNAARYDALMQAADRVWTAAEELDRQRGDDAAWRWLWDRFRPELRGERTPDVEDVLRLARALEARRGREAAA